MQSTVTIIEQIYFSLQLPIPTSQKYKENLLPGQTSSDQPDLIVHVFHAKMKQLLEDIHKHGVMGKTIA